MRQKDHLSLPDAIQYYRTKDNLIHEIYKAWIVD